MIRAVTFQGPIFAIVTPFDRGGRIDFSALDEYLGFLHGSGARTLIVNGTTGEFPSMTIAERKRVLEFCRLHFAGCLIANISACAAKDCTSLLEHASDTGADGVIILPPYYFSNATSSGLMAFFQSVLRRSAIPALLYNFPRHTNVEITRELLAALCEANGMIRGIKDSGGDLGVAAGLKSARPGLQVFFGSDTLAFEALERGLDGFVTGGGNAVPECPLGITQAFAGGRKDKALRWQKVLDLWAAYRKSRSALEIAVAKAGLAVRIPGFPVCVRPPPVLPG
ncbi:MAG: dihydrodipicolinate synthase family protein [Chloroflexi bacterium]|nr:dihydrodipicolinate synthase family protein [Chloroflexota bacterium]